MREKVRIIILLYRERHRASNSQIVSGVNLLVKNACLFLDIIAIKHSLTDIFSWVIIEIYVKWRK